MSETLPKPMPVPDGDSRQFWEAAAEGKLLLQRCGDCGAYIFYPRTLCPACHSDRLEWKEAGGEGTIYTYTIARRAAGPAFQADVPYVIALIDLEEGPRMMSNIVTEDVEAVRIGQRVKVTFDDSGEYTLPKFTVVD